jgi:hypothetical protein
VLVSGKRNKGKSAIRSGSAVKNKKKEIYKMAKNVATQKNSANKGASSRRFPSNLLTLPSTRTLTTLTFF